MDLASSPQRKVRDASQCTQQKQGQAGPQLQAVLVTKERPCKACTNSGRVKRWLSQEEELRPVRDSSSQAWRVLGSKDV